ncbi:MAG: hypothetical protein P8017_17370 [Deltaproteobacteria bacterium]|jgi:hypothetical protein
MKSKHFALIAALGLLVLFTAYPVKAQPTDEMRLAAMQEEIDAEYPPGNYNSRVGDLARLFQIDPATVNELRNSGQGWGEITIELSIADHLFKQDPPAFLTFGDALDRVIDLRASGEGWGRIAQDLGLKLGPIISAVETGRYRNRGVGDNALSGKTRGTSRIHKREIRTKQARLNSHSRPMRPTRATRPVRPMRPRRPVRLGR